MAQDYFSGNELRGNLKRRSVRSGAVTITSEAAKFLLYMGSMAVLARLLPKAEFGMVAMVTAITGFMAVFKDLGLSAATIQRREITHEQVSGLFWINVAIGGVLTLLVAGASPLVVWFYKDDHRLLAVTVAISTVFVIGGLGGQHQALLVRQMRFRRIAIVNLTAVVCGTAAGLAMALGRKGYLGAGLEALLTPHGAYWALVSVPIVTAAVGTAGLWLASGWRPSLPTRGVGLRSLVVFGSHVTGFNAVNYLARNMDNALIGRRWGDAVLGGYATAYRLLTLPLVQVNAPLASVAVPTLSRLRDNPERYRKYYLQAVSWIAFVTMPGIMFMIVYSQKVVALALGGGEKWADAGRIFMVLGIAGLFQPVTSTSGWFYLSHGRGKALMRWGIASAALIIASFFIGLPYGASGVATAYTAASLMQVWPCMYFATKNTPVSVGAIVGKLWRTYAATFAAGGAAAWMRWGMPGLEAAVTGSVGGRAISAVHRWLPALADDSVARIGDFAATGVFVTIGFAATAAAYVVATCALAGGTQPLREAKSLVGELLGKGRGAAAPTADGAKQ
jgi:PST family polysaccharide transporter